MTSSQFAKFFSLRYNPEIYYPPPQQSDGSGVTNMYNLPVDDFTVRFPVIEGITGRVTPWTFGLSPQDRLINPKDSELYVFEFLQDSTMTSVADTTQFKLFHEDEFIGPVFFPVGNGPGCTIRLYTLEPDGEYRVYCNDVLRGTLTFPRVIQIKQA